MSLQGKLRPTLLGIGAVIYLGLGYLASSSNHPPLLVVLVTLIPVVAGFLAACWPTSWRLPAIAFCVVAALGAVVLITVMQRTDLLLSHAAWFYFFQHVGAMAALGVMFGSTLRTREGALCSRIAQVAIAAPLDAQYCLYTWRVTLAWTAYFAISAVVSCGLFFMAPLETWSLFASVLTPISLALMFGFEYLIRLRALPDRPHFSIAQTINSYQKYVQRRGCAE